jgi:hypothetical protein
VKGSSTAIRARVTVAFGAAFIAAAMLVFAAASFAGTGVRALVAVPWRAAAAAAALFTLGVVDVLSLRARSYCLLGAKRQARQSLIRTYSMPVVAAAWGFDTGLAFTTYRVSAATWAAFALALLGFAPWWSGVAYGIAFTVPMLALLLSATTFRRLDRELRRRPLIQAVSAVALAGAGALLLMTR